jgi:hypothetical protein
MVVHLAGLEPLPSFGRCGACQQAPVDDPPLSARPARPNRCADPGQSVALGVLSCCACATRTRTRPQCDGRNPS